MYIQCHGSCWLVEGYPWFTWLLDTFLVCNMCTYRPILQAQALFWGGAFQMIHPKLDFLWYQRTPPLGLTETPIWPQLEWSVVLLSLQSHISLAMPMVYSKLLSLLPSSYFQVLRHTETKSYSGKVNLRPPLEACTMLSCPCHCELVLQDSFLPVSILRGREQKILWSKNCFHVLDTCLPPQVTPCRRGT